MQATVTGLLGRDTLHARIDEIKRAKGAAPWVEKLVVNDQRAGDFVFAPARHYHHIRPAGTVPSIRLAITPPGEVHRHDRPESERPEL